MPEEDWLRVPDGLRVPVREGVDVYEGDGEADSVAVVVAEGVADVLGDGVTLGDSLVECVDETDADALAVPEALEVLEQL